MNWRNKIIVSTFTDIFRKKNEDILQTSKFSSGLWQSVLSSPLADDLGGQLTIGGRHCMAW